MASVADWSTTAASNTTVGGISTDGSITLVKQLDNMIRGLMAEVATSRDDGTITSTFERGHIFGLTLSNNVSDATNDIDISAGECAAIDSPYWKIALASALTKRLDAAWAVGSGNGGLDTGAVASASTYHVWLIKRSDTGVVDALFSLSATAPTMPANYDRKRRIGSFTRDGSGVNRPFTQTGDMFTYTSPVQNRSSTAALAAALTNTATPQGIVTQPIMSIQQTQGTVGDVVCGIGNASASSTISNIVATTVAGMRSNAVASDGLFTNTSAQIYYQVVINSGTIASQILTTVGWYDKRDRP